MNAPPRSLCGAARPVGEITDDLVADLRFERQVEKLQHLPREQLEVLKTAEDSERTLLKTWTETLHGLDDGGGAA